MPTKEQMQVRINELELELQALTDKNYKLAQMKDFSANSPEDYERRLKGAEMQSARNKRAADNLRAVLTHIITEHL